MAAVYIGVEGEAAVIVRIGPTGVGTRLVCTVRSTIGQVRTANCNWVPAGNPIIGSAITIVVNVIACLLAIIGRVALFSIAGGAIKAKPSVTG